VSISSYSDDKCCTETCAFRHTDYGITTLLFSIPITGLVTFLGPDELLLMVIPRHLRGTFQSKVAEPPADQQHEQRLSLVLFNASKGDMRLKPVTGRYLQSLDSLEYIFLTLI
jgi:hypothetical protein